MSKPQWKLLTKKRESATKGVPPGKEAPAWVTNTVTLICGQRDAVVVDTFLSAQQSKKLVDRVVDASTSTALERYEEMALGDRKSFQAILKIHALPQPLQRRDMTSHRGEVKLG